MAYTKTLIVSGKSTLNKLSAFIDSKENLSILIKDSLNGNLETVFTFDEKADIDAFILELQELKSELYGTETEK